MNEEHWDGKLADAARSYHEPPPAPRDEMWEAIQAARRTQGRVTRPPVRWLVWGVGIAALLALGIGIGRLTVIQEQRGSAKPIAAGPQSAGRGSVAVDLVATQHLTQAEAFLTGFRAEAKAGGSAMDFVASARGMLTTTRLLLDSPDLRDARIRGLLEELEFVLAQIGQLQAVNGSGERNLITEGLKQRGLMPRLRSAIPAGAAAPGAQGEL